MDKKTNILYLITDLELHGAQHQLLELIKGLDKERFRPLVVALCQGGPMEHDYRSVLGDDLISMGRNGKYDFFYIFKIMSLIRKMKVDVIQPFLTPATFFGLLPAILCGTPVKIVTERNSIKVKEYGSLGHQCYLKAEDFLTRFADWAVSNSESGRDCLIERGVNPDHAKAIYNGINLSNFEYDINAVKNIRSQLDVSKGGKVIGIIARMHPVKRHDVFLKAAAIVHREIPDTRFALLGDGPLRNNLENLVHELGINSSVVFLGEQQNTVPYIASFDIVAMSSDSEGLSLSLCESMALGKPIVATDAGGNRELVEDGTTGFIVPLGDYEALANSIIRLLRDPETARAMGQRARDKISTRFSPENMVHQYQDLYEETLVKKHKFKDQNR